MSSLADKMLAALRRLAEKYQPHPCGGFTTDDIQWRMGTAFLGEPDLHAALDEPCLSGCLTISNFSFF